MRQMVIQCTACGCEERTDSISAPAGWFEVKDSSLRPPPIGEKERHGDLCPKCVDDLLGPRKQGHVWGKRMQL